MRPSTPEPSSSRPSLREHALCRAPRRPQRVISIFRTDADDDSNDEERSHNGDLLTTRPSPSFALSLAERAPALTRRQNDFLRLKPTPLIVKRNTPTVPRSEHFAGTQPFTSVRSINADYSPRRLLFPMDTRDFAAEASSPLHR